MSEFVIEKGHTGWLNHSVVHAALNLSRWLWIEFALIVSNLKVIWWLICIHFTHFNLIFNGNCINLICGIFILQIESVIASICKAEKNERPNSSQRYQIKHKLPCLHDKVFISSYFSPWSFVICFNDLSASVHLIYLSVTR